MTCEIVAAPAAIAQMLSADRSIRGTVPRRNIITALSVTRHFFRRFLSLLLIIANGKWIIQRSSDTSTRYDRKAIATVRNNFKIRKRFREWQSVSN